MAKKRLNKKVAIFGAVILICMAVLAAFVLRRMMKDPVKLLAEAEAGLIELESQLTEYSNAIKSESGHSESALEQMLEAGEETCLNVIHKYREAYGATKGDAQKIELLFKMSDFYLEANEFHEPEWKKALRTWNTVTNIDPKNIEARMKILDYLYTLASESNPGYWANVKEQVSGSQENDSEGLIQIMAEKQMEPDLFVLKAKARANLELASAGQVTDPSKTIDEAIADFESLLKLTPDDIETYKFLSDALLLRGEIRNSIGHLKARENALVEAENILQKAIDTSPDNPTAYINLLQLKLGSIKQDKEKIAAMEPEFTALVAKFGDSDEAYSALSGYWQIVNNPKKAIAAISRAIELDDDNIGYALIAANLYYRKSMRETGDKDFHRAVEIADNALAFPDALIIPGPREYKYRNNRLNLLSFLSRMYTIRAVDAGQAGDTDQQQTWASKAKKNIDAIIQIYGSEDSVYAGMWRGILKLSQGRKQPAIQEMYDAYEQLKASQRDNAILSYMLSRALQDSPEIGSRMEFLRSSILTGFASINPEVLLDYADMILKVRGWNYAISLAQAYETAVPPNDRSKGIQVSALIYAKQFDKAEESLNQMNSDSSQTKLLRLSLLDSQVIKLLQDEREKALTPEQQQELDGYQKTRAALLAEVLSSDSDSVNVNTLAAVCDYHLEQGDTETAKSLTDTFIAGSPNNANAILYKYKLMEADPLNITNERVREITPKALSQIKDITLRTISLARFHITLGRNKEAVSLLQKAITDTPDNKDLIEYLFEALISDTEPDVQLIQETAQLAAKMNLDECDGNFYLARMDFARSDFESSLTRVGQCIKTRPVYSRGYFLQSRINGALGNHDQSIKDALTAASMNPTDPMIVKQKIAVLHDQNIRLGRNVTEEQLKETEKALREGIIVNPNDWKLQSVYAEYRSKDHPEEALATRQHLQSRYPNLSTHLLLGDLAMKIADTESDKDKKLNLLEIADSAYQKALGLEPSNKVALEHYSEYLRVTGQQDKIAEIFGEQDDLLWQFYLRDGQYDKAREILAKLYEQDPGKPKPVVLRGLTLIASRTGNNESMMKYSEELLAAEDTMDNELMQIQLYIDNGLVNETTLKLASFRERYPQEPRGILLEGWVATVKGQLDKALQLVNRYLEEDPDNAGAWRLRGMIHRFNGNNSQAVEDLQKSKSIGSNATISIELARAYRNSNRMSAAIGELRNALKDEMAPLKVRTLLEQFYREAGRKSDLQNFYQECIDKFPDSEIWYYRAAQFYLGENDLTTAEQLLEKAWQITTKSKNISGMVFDLYLETLWLAKQYDKVISIASDYIDGPLASVAYSQLGQTRAKMGNKTAAVDYYYKALAKSSDNDAMISGILRNMEQAVGWAEVETWVTNKLASEPESLIANIIMFNLAKQKGQYNKALKHLDIGMSVLTSTNPGYYRYSNLKANTLSLAYIKTSDKQYLSQAIDQYKSILEDKPNLTNALNNLAYLIAENTTDYTQAEEYGARAYSSNPNNPNVIDTYAYTLCKTGKYSKAEELLHTAIQLHEIQGNSVPWDMYKHLGSAQEGLGHKAEAASSYNLAIVSAGKNINSSDKQELDDAIKRVSE